MTMLIALLIGCALAKLAYDVYKVFKWLEATLGFTFKVIVAVINVGFRLVVVIIIANVVVYFTCGLVLVNWLLF